MGKYAVSGQPCPKCNSSDSLALYHDHGGWCFSNCGYVTQRYLDGNTTQPNNSRSGIKKMSRWNIAEVQDFPLADLTHRGITDEAVEKYSVRQPVRPEDGTPDEQAIFFPAGATGGYKRKNKLAKKDTEIVGDYVGLFGQKVFPRGGKFLIVTEGEEDALYLAGIQRAGQRLQRLLAA